MQICTTIIRLFFSCWPQAGTPGVAGESSTDVRRANLSFFAEAFSLWRMLCTDLDRSGIFLWANIAPEVTDLMNEALSQALWDWTQATVASGKVLNRMCRVLTGSSLHMLRSLPQWIPVIDAAWVSSGAPLDLTLLR